MALTKSPWRRVPYRFRIGFWTSTERITGFLSLTGSFFSFGEWNVTALSSGAILEDQRRSIEYSRFEIAARSKDMPLPIAFKELETLGERQEELSRAPKRPAGKPPQSLPAL